MFKKSDLWNIWFTSQKYIDKHNFYSCKSVWLHDICKVISIFRWFKSLCFNLTKLTPQFNFWKLYMVIFNHNILFCFHSLRAIFFFRYFHLWYWLLLQKPNTTCHSNNVLSWILMGRKANISFLPISLHQSLNLESFHKTDYDERWGKKVLVDLIFR